MSIENGEIAIIVALTRKGVMGKNNSLPWHLPEDLRRFKSLTLGHPIIMGRKTFESIGRALPGRLNIVISRQKDLKVPAGVEVVSSLNSALLLAGATKKKFIIGGASLIEESLSIANTVYLTWIEKDFDGDVIISDPEKKLSSFTLREERYVDSPFPHTYTDYIK